jgi:cytochrome b pre-mRNA-processing protein 3
MPPTTAPTITTNVTADALPSSELEAAQAPSASRAAGKGAPTVASPVSSDGNPSSSPPNGAPTRNKSSANSASPASVAQMQRQIQSSLTASRTSSVFSLPQRAARALDKNLPSATHTYNVYAETEDLFKIAAAQADYTIPQDQRMNILTGKGPAKEASQGGAELGQPVPESKDTMWFTTLNLPPTFSTWSQVTFLHMWVGLTKLRDQLESEKEFQNYYRYLTEHFSRSAEEKMVLLHNMSAQGIRSRYLKDLFMQWRGIVVSYDEGLVKGDAVLATAVWRNLFRADENVDWVKVAQVVAYLRIQLAPTDGWVEGQIKKTIAGLIAERSRGIQQPLDS